MHVVAQAGAVRGGVVRAKHLQRRSDPAGGVKREGDEVRLGIVVFADGTVRRGTGGVEIAEGGKTQPVGAGQRLKGVFHVQLGLSVGVDRDLRGVLGDGHLLRCAVGRAGRGEDEFFYPGAEHAAQQVQGGGDVVEIVFERVGHALADVGVGREVHDELNLLLPEDFADLLLIAKIGGIEGDIGRHRRPVPEDQIVEHDRPVAGGKELPDTMTSDVTGAANDKNVHFGSVVLLSGRGWLAIFVS